MTQPTNDPWATAQAAPVAQPAAINGANTEAAYATYGESFGGPNGSTLLFNQGASVPSLFNKAHPLGTERSGIITKTEDKQDQDFNAKAPKFWSHSRTGGPKRNHAITLDPIDELTGQRNRPVMVTHISLDTDYRITEAECVSTGRDVAYVGQDEGKRVDVVGGFDFEPFAKAIADAKARGIVLNSSADLIGKRLTKKRAGQRPNPGGYPSWINAYRIDNA